MKDVFDDRMKMYESKTDIRLMPLLPTFARVDGRAFHSFTKGMDRPFDMAMIACMRYTAMHLAKETNALMTYTQSDEITMCWYSGNINSQIWFDLRHSKMVSQIASLATLHFNRACEVLLPSYRD